MDEDRDAVYRQMHRRLTLKANIPSMDGQLGDNQANKILHGDGIGYGGVVAELFPIVAL